MTHGGWSPHRDQVISANPGRGVKDWLSDSASHGSASWDGVACKVFWVVAVVCGTGCLLPQAANRDPLEWAQWVLLWLCSHWMGSADLDEVIFTQLEDRASLRTSSFVKVVNGSTTCQSSSTLSAKWQDLLGIGSWAFSTQYWRAFA